MLEMLKLCEYGDPALTYTKEGWKCSIKAKLTNKHKCQPMEYFTLEVDLEITFRTAGQAIVACHNRLEAARKEIKETLKY